MKSVKIAEMLTMLHNKSNVFRVQVVYMIFLTVKSLGERENIHKNDNMQHATFKNLQKLMETL